MSFRDPVIELVNEVVSELRRAYFRMLFRTPMAIPGLLENYSPEELAEYITPFIVPPLDREEAKIQLLADLAISLLYPEKKIDSIIWKALIEIRKAYAVVLKSGGGWSASSKPDEKKKAVLDWFRRNQPRLSYLKETHLQDENLYNFGSGQEKRDFITRMIKKIVEDEAGTNLNFQNVKGHLENLKKLRQPLRFDEL